MADLQAGLQGEEVLRQTIYSGWYVVSVERTAGADGWVPPGIQPSAWAG